MGLSCVVHTNHLFRKSCKALLRNSNLLAHLLLLHGQSLEGMLLLGNVLVTALNSSEPHTASVSTTVIALANEVVHKSVLEGLLLLGDDVIHLRQQLCHLCDALLHTQT